ncbi:hypothetical protein PoB_003858300 [Plakobranchus ocellatus]|uniref:Uncharacterized protein n=1 Tax=Plakobranchus ocellatus TaxID=259542 RepID=A0AAV4AZ14_9GAST|nr:hypothetical protein PoB_003858300 [Plakobranchus ocellatus]
MGSSSSKSGSNPPTKSKKEPPPKPVANVNKQESNERDVSVRQDRPLNVESNLHLSGPIAPIESNKNDSKTVDKDDPTKKSKNSKLFSNKSSAHNPTALQFEDDSDVDDDIDAVLKIPMSIEPSRKDRNKEKRNKKDKNNDKENFDSQQMSNDYNRNYYDQNMDMFSQKENEALPETYAQRLQRQQYKLQQDMLIREKTSIKNLRDWRQDDESDDEDISPRTGFDASKFRAANKGGDVKTDLFSTVKDDLQTPRYLQSSGQELDEVETHRREIESPNQHLPQYNQSELDLMRQLEEEIL